MCDASQILPDRQFCVRALCSAAHEFELQSKTASQALCLIRSPAINGGPRDLHDAFKVEYGTRTLTLQDLPTKTPILTIKKRVNFCALETSHVQQFQLDISLAVSKCLAFALQHDRQHMQTGTCLYCLAVGQSLCVSALPLSANALSASVCTCQGLNA